MAAELARPAFPIIANFKIVVIDGFARIARLATRRVAAGVKRSVVGIVIGCVVAVTVIMIVIIMMAGIVITVSWAKWRSSCKWRRGSRRT